MIDDLNDWNFWNVWNVFPYLSLYQSRALDFYSSSIIRLILCQTSPPFVRIRSI
jgi:hypothetical protein